MREIWKKCILLTFVLFCSSIACTSVYVFGIDEDICEAMGGWWNPGDQDCIEPFYGNTPSEELNSEPANGNASEPIDENISDPINENASEPNEENNSEPISDISMEDCIAQPGEYTWEFANVNNEGSNDTKEVCQGDFYLQNISNRVLHYKLYKYYDNGAMQNIGWLHSCSRLTPEEAFSTYFETQTWTNGNKTVTTFTKLIVFYDLPDCVNFLVDKENETLWDDFAVPLSDPCR